MEIPIIGKLSQAQRFVEGLKILMTECGVTDSRYNFFGVNHLKFDDDSELNMIQGYMEAGYIDEDIYNEHYNKNLK